MEYILEGLKENWKRYLTSSLITFVAAFISVAVPQMLDDKFVWSQASLVGVVIVSARLGIKAVWELLKPVIIK